MSASHALKIAAVDQLTPNAVALTFNIPENLTNAFAFKAGQYITIKHEIDGKELRRAYSISSPPSSGKLTVGIKKVENGTFSVFANEHIKVGDTFEIMPPEGRFIFEDDSPKNIAAFAAGSGITPIMSIAQTVLESNPENVFVLVFGNQSPEETMYFKEIQAIKEQYGDRFFVQYVYSRSTEKDALFGRIEKSTVNFVLKNKFKETAFDGFYLCGPEDMIHLVTDTLKDNGVDEGEIHFELFTSGDAEDSLAEDLDGKTQVTVILDDESYNFVMDKKEIVLDAVLKQDIDAPYSCQGGVCSSCIARLTEGKAEMVKNQILTDGEINDGFVLTCQSHPITSKITVDFDNV
ncbi:ferredoxin--NADP reductase [Muricauda ruestringensis]|uniref:ferredoxin--NADP reductase n=1 Tax=Flagellimonas ruestringensis TaxID=111501 RepID=UPI001CD406D2|nr:ferredoxin--NADP reductase [Allomuricauda ruestringensis]MCA0958618.1 ferredoxin--NADP reductase [Allomuricauda ruestringensis]